MANYLKMAKISAILILKEQGWSQRRIARELGIHPDTVGRYIRFYGKEPKPATKAPTGSEDSKQDKAPPGQTMQIHLMKYMVAANVSPYARSLKKNCKKD